MNQPSRSGCSENPRFALQLQVNYEDTDAGGVVYYANYLAYMERARNACLRRLGFPLTVLKNEHGMLFVVTGAGIRYRAPARLDDDLCVTLDMVERKRASMVFAQQVCRGSQLLVEGEIRLGVVNAESFKPCRMPVELASALDHWSSGATAAESGRIAALD